MNHVNCQTDGQYSTDIFFTTADFDINLVFGQQIRSLDYNLVQLWKKFSNIEAFASKLSTKHSENFVTNIPVNKSVCRQVSYNINTRLFKSENQQTTGCPIIAFQICRLVKLQAVGMLRVVLPATLPPLCHRLLKSLGFNKK